MKQVDIPSRFKQPFGYAAGGSYIRAIPDLHVAPSGSDAPASLEDGFPPETFLAIGSGGIPPNGKDFNGLLNRISAWARWQAAGMPALFDSTFATAIGGYPKGAMIASTISAGLIWISTADDNATDPNGSSPANWAGVATTPAGKIDWFALTAAPSGWLKCNGAAVSRATYAGLFAAIGTTYGPGNGSTTFTLPDARGEFVRGLDDGRGVDPSRGLADWQADQNQAHSHTTAIPLFTSNPGGNVGLDANANFGGNQTFTSSASGGTEARPRNLAFLCCIKV